jgi:hypothetical protein
MPYLAGDDDLGREYSRSPGDPLYFVTSEVFAKIDNYLKANVLEKL